MHIDSCEIRKWFLRVALLSFMLMGMLIGLPLCAGAQGVDLNDTRLLSQPAISKNHVAFIYSGDLWVGDLDSKNVKRLTADEGLESNPAFSPDGSLVAFTAQYDAYWAMRYGADLKTPTASIQGPKVMLIDETAGSGRDLLPWMWRKFGMGKLVGKRTWGGLVGTLGFPVLMDAGGVTAPNLAIWTPEDGWVVENVGVPPDIEVEQVPADIINGHDPQLEKAI